MAKKDAVLIVRMDAKLYDKIQTACGNKGMKVSLATRLLFTAWICRGGRPQDLFPSHMRLLREKFFEYLENLCKDNWGNN